MHNYILQGWPEEVQSDLLPFNHRRSELTAHQGCVLWGSRVVIPVKGRTMLLEDLHEGHPGIVRMKSLARSYFWWSGLDADIEAKVKNCDSCQQNRKKPPQAPLHPWEWPGRPWHRVHIDFCRACGR